MALIYSIIGGLPKNDQEELLKTTSFDKSELNMWYKAFRTICPGGRFSNDSLRYLWTQLYFLDTLKHNEFGSIDFKDFMRIMNATTRASDEEKLKWLFRMYDNDNDGYITRDELYVYLVAAYKLTRPLSVGQKVEDLPSRQLEEFMELADKDKDGKISWTEFQEVYKIKPEMFELIPKFQESKFTETEIKTLKASSPRPRVYRPPVSVGSHSRPLSQMTFSSSNGMGSASPASLAPTSTPSISVCESYDEMRVPSLSPKVAQLELLNPVPRYQHRLGQSPLVEDRSQYEYHQYQDQIQNQYEECQLQKQSQPHYYEQSNYYQPPSPKPYSTTPRYTPQPKPQRTPQPNQTTRQMKVENPYFTRPLPSPQWSTLSPTSVYSDRPFEVQSEVKAEVHPAVQPDPQWSTLSPTSVYSDHPFEVQPNVQPSDVQSSDVQSSDMQSSNVQLSVLPSKVQADNFTF